MIQNNLDPEVAENPKELVICGGIGRAAQLGCFDAIIEALRKLGDDESLLIRRKASRRVKTHTDAPRVASPIQPRAEMGDVGSLQQARRNGLMMRPDDGWLVDLHRQPGHRAGHVQTFTRRAPALRRHR